MTASPTGQVTLDLATDPDLPRFRTDLQAAFAIAVVETFGRHSSLGYQTPAAFAGTLAATASDTSLDKGFASPPVAPTAPYGVTETAQALIATG